MNLAQNNSRMLTISLNAIPSIPDEYQLRLVGSGTSALASATGLLLDGDEDGSAGSDFTSVFTVNLIPAKERTLPTE
jgi:hypothetical protein